MRSIEKVWHIFAGAYATFAMSNSLQAGLIVMAAASSATNPNLINHQKLILQASTEAQAALTSLDEAILAAKTQNASTEAKKLLDDYKEKVQILFDKISADPGDSSSTTASNENSTTNTTTGENGSSVVTQNKQSKSVSKASTYSSTACSSKSSQAWKNATLAWGFVSSAWNVVEKEAPENISIKNSAAEAKAHAESVQNQSEVVANLQMREINGDQGVLAMQAVSSVSGAIALIGGVTAFTCGLLAAIVSTAAQPAIGLIIAAAIGGGALVLDENGMIESKELNHLSPATRATLRDTIKAKGKLVYDGDDSAYVADLSDDDIREILDQDDYSLKDIEKTLAFFNKIPDVDKHDMMPAL